MSACDELDGMPSSQVTRFQTIPPDRPAATTVSVTSFVLTSPFAIVAATARERNAPTRFSTPDRATATLGSSALVAIDVAIALPVSWKPLVKSKPRAVMTTRTSTTSLPTRLASLPGLPLSRGGPQRLIDCHLQINFCSTFGNPWRQLVRQYLRYVDFVPPGAANRGNSGARGTNGPRVARSSRCR